MRVPVFFIAPTDRQRLYLRRYRGSDKPCAKSEAGGHQYCNAMLYIGDAPVVVDLADTVEYLQAIQHPRAIEGFDADMDALRDADIVVLVLPCGKSAHLELGWAVGAGKRTCVYVPEETLTPELMYRMVDHIAPDMMDLLAWLGVQD